MNVTRTGEASVFEKILESVPGGEKVKTCIQCGSCSSSCPAADGEVAYTHRQLWRLVQMGYENEILEIPNFWECTTCALCEQRCPRGIPLSKLIVALREYSVKEKGMNEPMSRLFKTLGETRNINGDAAQSRLLWLSNMTLSSAQRDKLTGGGACDVLYFTGCVASLFPQAYKIPQSLTAILFAAGVDFSLFGAGEWCCGYPLIGAGAGEDALKEYAQHTYDEIIKRGAKTVVLSCPTCMHIFEHIYKKLVPGFNDIHIQHYSVFLRDYMNSGAIKFKKGEDVTVTYHDPCDLGRKSKITSEPRAILKAMPGVTLSEMRFTEDEGKCCGGGGNLEMLDPELSGKVSTARVEEASKTGAAYILTTCQQCKRTLQAGARKLRSKIKVQDLLEFMSDRLEEAGATDHE